MITRTLIAAVVGIALAGGSVADASAKVVAQTGSKSVVTKTVGGKQLRTVAVKHRALISHRAMTKRVKTVKFVGGKRIVVSHFVKRIALKHV